MQGRCTIATAAMALVVMGCAAPQATAPAPPTAHQPAPRVEPPTEPVAKTPEPAPDRPRSVESPPRATEPPSATPDASTTRPTTRPAKPYLFREQFSGSGRPSPDRWVVRNPSKQRVVVQEGALVVRGEARKRATRVEFQIQERLPAFGRWTLEFDALVNSLWGRGEGEVRVELRDYATRLEPAGNDLAVAERYVTEHPGLKFGVFQGGAFVGWQEVAKVGELGAWHHYRVAYDAGTFALWRDGERLLDCDAASMLDQPLVEGVAVEMGFHVPKGCGIEGCIDNVTIVTGDDEEGALKP